MYISYCSIIIDITPIGCYILAMKKDALLKIINQFGSQKALAALLQIPQQNISRWLLRCRVPVKHVLILEKLSAGTVNRHDLRPDIYPKEK